VKQWPEWANYKGFVLCFHHAFWQAAYHGFRAKCRGYEPLKESGTAFVQVELEDNKVHILNVAVPVAPEQVGKPSRDATFFDDLNARLEGNFVVEMPVPHDDYWKTTIRRTHPESQES
jgi:hypothetical protein